MYEASGCNLMANNSAECNSHCQVVSLVMMLNHVLFSVLTRPKTAVLNNRHCLNSLWKAKVMLNGGNVGNLSFDDLMTVPCNTVGRS